MIFGLLFEYKAVKTKNTRYFVPTSEIKDYSGMVARRNCFNQPVKNDLRTYDNIKKITAGQRDDYATSCLLDYNYFRNIIRR